MPQVTIRTGFKAPNGQEKVLHEYLCDWADCPNIAVQVIGCAREIGVATAVCEEHAAIIKART
jgi:hypothetical protein